mgnify:FL=1
MQKKWAAEPRKVRQPCQPKNDTYETLCVTLNQIIYVDYEPVHHA